VDNIPHGTLDGYREHRRRGHTVNDMRKCKCAAVWTAALKRGQVQERRRAPEPTLSWVRGKHGILKGVWTDRYGNLVQPPKGN
jgi:hypothetical protein